jgi:hypothetical protein
MLLTTRAVRDHEHADRTSVITISLADSDAEVLVEAGK